MVTPDNILGNLEQLFDTDEEGIETYRTMVNLVRTALYSVFPERRRDALDSFEKDLGFGPVDIATTEKDGVTSAYIRLVKNHPYLFVENYETNEPIEEEVPTAEEMENW